MFHLLLRRRRTGEMVQLMHAMKRYMKTAQFGHALEVERIGYIMTNKYKSRIGEEMIYVLLAAGQVIINANNVGGFVAQKVIAQVTASKSRAASY